MAAAFAGLVLVLVSVASNETGAGLSAPGGGAIFLGSLTGMVGTYLALLMVLLVSRIPFAERILGQDGLVRWHRRLAAWPLSLIGLHVVFVTIGYAQAAKAGVWAELGSLINGYPDVLAATFGAALMALAAVTSVRAVRDRLRRETWWIIHLYLYLALVLSFAHAVAIGPSFVAHPAARTLWSLAWGAAAALIVGYRFGLPLVRSLRHRIVVEEVRPEAPGVVSVVCRGAGLDRLAIAGGQFFEWRFLERGLWWQAHPYSISALPRPPRLRLTVKVVGDHSAAVARLRPGTRVWIEGPYGAFTRHARRWPSVVLIAGGAGLTALRSLIEDLPARSAPEVIVRVSAEEQLLFRSEIAELARHRKGRVHELVGRRDDVVIDSALLRRLVPDITRRDVYVCGPIGFVDHVVAVTAAMGLDRRTVHYEKYGF